MEAALRVIGRSGLESLTHRAVAAEAGVSLGAVTHRHRRRDDLAAAAMAYAVSRETARAEAFALRLQSEAFDLPAWIAAVAAHYQRELETNRDRHAACCEALLAAARDPRHRPAVEAWLAAWRRAPELALRAAGLVDAMVGAVLRQLAVPQADFGRALQRMLAAMIGGWMQAGGGGR